MHCKIDEKPLESKRESLKASRGQLPSKCPPGGGGGGGGGGTMVDSSPVGSPPTHKLTSK